MKDRYFSHDQNALSDNKIADLRGTYRMEGYGVYWAIVEALSREPELSLPLTERKAAAFQVSLSPSFDMMQFFRDCIEIGLFETDGEKFWSNSLRRRMEEATEVSRRNRAAALKRWGKREESATPAEPSAPEVDTSAYDPNWKRVADAYMNQIGMLPMGTAGEALVSYCDELGPDAMIVAIRRTNEAQPGNPYKFLKAILDTFADAKVRSEAEAIACCNEFDRKLADRKRGGKRAAERPASAPQEGTPDDGDVKWLVQ